MAQLAVVLPDAIRTANQKIANQASVPQMMSATVTNVDGQGNAFVHIDGDDADANTQSTIVGVIPSIGDRVMTIFAGHANFTLGTIGGVDVGSGSGGGGLTVAEHALIPHDPLVTQHLRYYPFFNIGTCTPAASPVVHFVYEAEVPQNVVARCNVAPTTSDLILDVKLDGTSILPSPLHITAGSAAGAQFYATTFTVTQVQRRNAIDPAALTGHILTQDSGATASDLTLLLVTQPVPNPNPV